MRYTSWLEKSQQSDEALASFDKACSKFIAADKYALRLSYALSLEAYGDAQNARNIYSQVLQHSKSTTHNKMLSRLDFRVLIISYFLAPNHVEAIVKYAHFERRQGNRSLQITIEPYLQVEALSDREKAFLKVQIAKHLHQVIIISFCTSTQYIIPHTLLRKSGQVSEAREYYAATTKTHPSSKYAWLNYAKFELSFYGQSIIFAGLTCVNSNTATHD